MSLAGVLELVAWILSALIAGWLIMDMTAVSRRHTEDELTSAGEHLEGLAKAAADAAAHPERNGAGQP